MWKFVLARNILVLSNACILIYAEDPVTVLGSCDEAGGVCLNTIVDEDPKSEDVVTSNVLAVTVFQASGLANADKHERGGRVLGLGWVAKSALAIMNLFGFGGGQLSNIPVAGGPIQNIIPACNMSDYEPCRGGKGICTSPSSCESRGGKTLGRCEKCIGCTTCCQFISSCRGNTDHYISYFQSPRYPKSDRRNDACSLIVNIREDVGQIRLDLLDFELPHPLGGVCVDYIQIINTAQPGGVFGPGNNYLCGLNSGQHIYLPVTAGSLLMLRAVTSGVLNVPLASMSGRGRGLSGDTQFRWNIKITQIPTMKRSLVPTMKFKSSRNMHHPHCKMSVPNYYRDLAAPEGCDQYHMNARGDITSFNYDGRSEINMNYDYTICVKRPLDTCGMTTKAISFSLPATAPCLTGYVNVDVVAGGLCCTVAAPKTAVPPTGTTPTGLAPGVNYFGFPGFSDGTIQSQPVTNLGGFSQYSSVPWLQRYYFCGQSLGNPDTNLVVARVKGPLIVKVKTADAYWGPNQFAIPPVSSFCPTGGCVGFKVLYDVDTGSC